MANALPYKGRGAWLGGETGCHLSTGRAMPNVRAEILHGAR